MRLSSRVVKNFRTPFSGGASAMGFVASITVLPARSFASHSRTAASAPVPFTASTTSSAQAATSLCVPVPTCPCSASQSWIFSGWRVARRT